MRDISLEVCGGEIVGIAGVSGNGQKELVEVLLGQRIAKSGKMRVEDVPIMPLAGKFASSHFQPSGRADANACVPGMSVAENMAFRILDLPPIAKGWRLNRRAMLRRARSLIESTFAHPSRNCQ